MQKHILPTGYLFVDDYAKGKLETLSIGDYGKAHNVKADFLGYTRPLNGVPNTPCMPISEKLVITVSTQYGCPMRCTFCDVPKVEWHGNVSFADLKKQFYSERLNLHYARMGDPIFNDAVFDFAEWAYLQKREIFADTGMRIEVLHPVLTTSLPNRLKTLQSRILRWCDIKNGLYNGQAGMQFSINSTDDAQRADMFAGLSLPLAEFAKIADRMPDPISRKYCLNFAYSSDFVIDADLLARMFSAEKFMVKITPIHNNNACVENGIKTIDGYESYVPYARAEEELKIAGFDVLVFVPSIDEEDGLVTCGNAILGGSRLKTSVDLPSIVGV
jgi:23S rRNA (adenine2503-C2)-methyltransferase